MASNYLDPFLFIPQHDIEEVISFSMFVIMDPSSSHEERTEALETLRATQEKLNRHIVPFREYKGGPINLKGEEETVENPHQISTSSEAVTGVVYLNAYLSGQNIEEYCKIMSSYKKFVPYFSYLTSRDPFIFLEESLKNYWKVKEHLETEREAHIKLYTKAHMNETLQSLARSLHLEKAYTKKYIRRHVRSATNSIKKS